LWATVYTLQNGAINFVVIKIRVIRHKESWETRNRLSSMCFILLAYYKDTMTVNSYEYNIAVTPLNSRGKPSCRSPSHEMSTCYGIWRFVIVFAGVSSRALSWAIWLQYTYSRLWCGAGGMCTGGWTKGLLLVESSMTHQAFTLLHTDWKHQAVESSV
jgi:hypothetical protein